MPHALHHLVTAPWPRRDDAHWPASLAQEGFVHLCTAAQLPGVRARFYAAVPVTIWTLDAEALDDVRFEDTYGHGSYPHLYGPIPVGAVLAETPWPVGAPCPIPDDDAP